jgi:hypothetical protein
MRAVLKGVALLAVLALPQAVPAQDPDIPVPLCFEPMEAGAMRVRSRDGGWFQVIPPGGLDDQEEYFLEAVVRPGATLKLAGGQFQQYIEILTVERDAVLVRNAGWARFIGEFSQVKRFPYGCEASGLAPELTLSFAGIGLGSDINQVATKFPNSKRVRDYIYVAQQDVRDHVFGIELSGAGPGRRVRLSFERPSGPPQYPTCEQIQAMIEAGYGPPGSIQSFAEERQRRSDRHWQRSGERLTLQCFSVHERGWFAEADVITPKTQ